MPPPCLGGQRRIITCYEISVVDLRLAAMPAHEPLEPLLEGEIGCTGRRVPEGPSRSRRSCATALPQPYPYAVAPMQSQPCAAAPTPNPGRTQAERVRHPIKPERHGRACPGHPAWGARPHHTNQDARGKRGHDVPIGANEVYWCRRVLERRVLKRQVLERKDHRQAPIPVPCALERPLRGGSGGRTQRPHGGLFLPTWLTI